MTMETYRWQRKHESEPPATVSVLRTLPKGRWTVHSEDWTVPPGAVSEYDTLERAMSAADQAVAAYVPHDCGRTGCGDWMPVPPAPTDASPGTDSPPA